MATMRGSRREDALSEIVGFVLVLALVVVASTLYLMYVVPAEGREDEITQMNQVQDRFISYKESIDGLWMRSLADLSVPGTRGVSLSTSFDLGTGGGNTQSSGLFLSFMRPIGTAAKMRTQLDDTPNEPTTERIGLTVDGNERFQIPDPDNPDGFFIDVPMGSLSYHTDNYYWIQQIYHYKLGGVFLEQPGEGVSVKVAPAIAIYGVKKSSAGDAPTVPKLSLSLINITSPDNTVGGTGPLRVETRLRESASSTYRNKLVESVTLRIYGLNHDLDPHELWINAWRQVIVDAVQKSGLPANNLDNNLNDWFYLNVHEDHGIPVVELTIRNLNADPAGSKDVYLDLTEAPLQVTFEYDEP